MSEYVFTLPDLGEGLAEAEIVQWLVDPGQPVAVDQPLVSVETAKSLVELPSPVAGVVARLGGAPGDIVPVGSPLVVLDRSAPNPTGPSDPTAPPGPAARVLAAPSVRRLATEHGVDLSALAGSGPGGRITREDVLAAVAPAAPAAPVAPVAPAPVAPAPVGDQGPAPAADTVRQLRGVRRQIAQAMTRSWAIPHITEFREIDATALLAARDELRASEGAPEHFSVLPVLVRVVTTALRRHPLFNATLDMDREEVTVHAACHVGIATATEHGLVVPVLRDADRLGVFELGRRIAKLATAARSRSLSPADTTGATFTVTNFGSYGTWLGTPLIAAPQVGIVGFGRIRDAVVAVDGAPVVRAVLPIAVSADHRVLDGDQVAGFVRTVELLVTRPLLLLAEDG